MKFVILTQYYPPEVGAPQARLSALAASLTSVGHQVTVLTAMPSYPTGKIHEGYGGLFMREDCDGVPVVRTFIYPTQRVDFVRRLTNYFTFVISSSALGTIFLEPSDYLIVESPPLFLGLAGLWLTRSNHTRLIFNVSDLWPESAVNLGVLRRNSLLHRISERLEAFCYSHAWLITGQSKSILSNITTRFPGCRTFHLSNAVDIKRFRPECRAEAVRKKFSNNGSCVVLYAGLHGLAQGLDQVLDSAEALRNESEMKFVLVGDGPEKGRLIRAAHERALSNVSFLKAFRAKDVPALLASAEIALVTLKTHIVGAVPSKLYEAMASGLPVILVAEGEAAEIVRQHNAGITVSPGDVGALIQALRSLAADPILRRTLGENGRRAAEEYFDQRTIATQFIYYLETNLRLMVT